MKQLWKTPKMQWRPLLWPQHLWNGLQKCQTNVLTRKCEKFFPQMSADRQRFVFSGPAKRAEEKPWNCLVSRLFQWQREKDSNPHKQSQSLSCYPYTIPLYSLFLCPPSLRDENDYTTVFHFVKEKFHFFQIFRSGCPREGITATAWQFRPVC